MVLPCAGIAPPPGHPGPQPGFVPPHMNADKHLHVCRFLPSSMPSPTCGLLSTRSYCGPGGGTVTVLVPSRAATTVAVLQGEIFEIAPVSCAPTASRQSLPSSTRLAWWTLCWVSSAAYDLGCRLIPCLINDVKDVTHLGLEVLPLIPGNPWKSCPHLALPWAFVSFSKNSIE